MSKNPIPQGKYKPAVRSGNLIFTAGMTPRKDGVLLLSGRIRAEEPIETYREAVRQAAENVLIATKSCLHPGEQIEQVLSLTVYINAEPEYRTHAKIGDIVSEYLYEQLGEPAIGARAAVGVASLPGEAPVEVQMVTAVK